MSFQHLKIHQQTITLPHVQTPWMSGVGRLHLIQSDHLTDLFQPHIRSDMFSNHFISNFRCVSVCVCVSVELADCMWGLDSRAKVHDFMWCDCWPYRSLIHTDLFLLVSKWWEERGGRVNVWHTVHWLIYYFLKWTIIGTFERATIALWVGIFSDNLILNI